MITISLLIIALLASLITNVRLNRKLIQERTYHIDYLKNLPKEFRVKILHHHGHFDK